MATPPSSSENASSEVSAVLKELRADLGALRADIDGLKADGARLGRSAMGEARGRAEAVVAEAKGQASRTVRTVEEDLAEVVSDVTETVQRNPFTTIGVAVLGGMLLSSLFRKD